jgi:hypothetical protein
MLMLRPPSSRSCAGATRMILFTYHAPLRSLVRPQRPATVSHRTVALEGLRAGGSPNVGYRPGRGRGARPGGPSQNAARNGDPERKQKVHTNRDG